jgi:hypothetical protein
MTTHWHVTHSRYIMWIGHCCKQVIFEKVFFPNQYKVFRLCLDFSIIIELKLGIDIFTQCRLWLPSWDQTALRHEKWKCRITILNDLECPNIVWTQSCTFITESYGLGIVRRDRSSTPDLENFFHCRFFCRFSPDFVLILPNPKRHCLITLWSMSDRISGESGRCRDRFGSRIGLNTGESGRIRMETAESGSFLNYILSGDEIFRWRYGQVTRLSGEEIVRWRVCSVTRLSRAELTRLRMNLRHFW